MRTTNHLEGWHSALNGRIKIAHINIFELIIHLRHFEDVNNNQRVLLDVGKPVPKQAKKYRLLNKRLKRFTQEYQLNEVTLLKFVRNVAANLPNSTNDPVEEPQNPASTQAAAASTSAGLPPPPLPDSSESTSGSESD